MKFVLCLFYLASSAKAFQVSNQQQQHRLLSPPTNKNVQERNENIQNYFAVPTIAAATILTTISIFGPTQPSFAVSGGGLDYAGLDISGQDYSNSKAYKGKDFTQTIAKGTDFSNSNLQGCRFYKAFLVNANFEGSDLRGASLEDTSMDGANLKNAIASGAYFGASLLDVGTAENADFTDAQIPPKTLVSFCSREDVVKGTNPVTGVDTRESLMCP